LRSGADVVITDDWHWPLGDITRHAQETLREMILATFSISTKKFVQPFEPATQFDLS
jgi:hypothetical protein